MKTKRRAVLFVSEKNHALVKRVCSSTLPLLPQASLSGGRQQSVLAYRAVATGCCCYHDNRCEQILEPFKKLVGDLLEVGKGGTKNTEHLL